MSKFVELKYYAISDSTNQHANQIDVDEGARVRVIFHFEEKKQISTYLRVMQPYAGDNYGFLFLPRVNTEVVVGFINGNPDKPIILKTLSNGENKYPHKLPNKKSDSYIRTTSTPAYEDFFGYNEIRFDDTKEDELLFIRAQRDYELYAKEDFNLNITNNKTTTQTNKDDDVKHNYTQSTGNSSNRTIKSNDIKIVEKEEVHTIKENKILTTKKDYTTIVQGTKREFIEQDLVQEIKEILHTYIEGDVTDKYLENFFVQVGKEMGVDLEGSLHIDTSSVKAESATTTEIEATDGISLKCGSNVLTIDPSGIHFNTDNFKDNSGLDGVVADAVEKNSQKTITNTYWSYGEDEIKISDTSRHYSDLNLHLETLDYEAGEDLSIDIKMGEEIHSFSTQVQEDGTAKILNIFEDKTLILKED
ncbi:bacteriophage T4 gp5 trimerisation domain-containing protein [Sulfurimonas sp.]|uniref:bacteriophage T4 gp5 trimerisation domain-containing protein n=1 Tax=Sulfurimonas sp. TaxID=2022749 RepID=UPI003D150305